MIRVCHLGKYYPPAPGGIETHVQTLARGQAALGAEVSVVCFNHGPEVHPSGRGLDRWLTRVPAEIERDGAVRLVRAGRFASVARFDVSLDLRRRILDLARGRADLFHLHVPNPAMLLALARLRLRAPLVITHHSDIVRQKVLGPALRPLEHLIFRRARCVLSTSAHYIEGSPLLRRYREKTGALPLGIELEAFLNPSPGAIRRRDELLREAGSPLWLCVGRLVYYKGLHNAVEALPKMPGKLLLVGRGPDETQLRRLAESRGVADRILWRGHVDFEELHGAYLAATALLFPSNARSEGFGLVQVEAMASGCPVINTAIPHSGVAWVSRDGETGLTVPMDDPAALAAAASRLASDRELRDKLAEGARRRAREEFCHGLMARRSLEIYQRVLAGEPLGSAPELAAG